MQRGMNSVWQRMIGAALLNPNAYEEVERDVDANGSALMIVIFAALAAGIGALTSNGVRGFVATIIAASDLLGPLRHCAPTSSARQSSRRVRRARPWESCCAHSGTLRHPRCCWSSAASSSWAESSQSSSFSGCWQLRWWRCVRHSISQPGAPSGQPLSPG